MYIAYPWYYLKIVLLAGRAAYGFLKRKYYTALGSTERIDSQVCFKLVVLEVKMYFVGEHVPWLSHNTLWF